MTKGGFFKSALGLAAALLMTASLSFAHLWGTHKSSAKSANITFDSPMTLANGKTLDAGSYRMEVSPDSPAPEVTFYKDGKSVAEAPAKVVTEDQKNSHTEIDSTRQGSDNVINEIRVSGWSENLVFNNANAQTNSASQ